MDTVRTGYYTPGHWAPPPGFGRLIGIGTANDLWDKSAQNQSKALKYQGSMPPDPPSLAWTEVFAPLTQNPWSNPGNTLHNCYLASSQRPRTLHTALHWSFWAAPARASLPAGTGQSMSTHSVQTLCSRDPGSHPSQIVPHNSHLLQLSTSRAL